MKKDLKPSWKQVVNIKNKIARANILLLQIYILLLIDKLGNETHLMIDTTKNITKSKLKYILIANDFFLYNFYVQYSKLSQQTVEPGRFEKIWLNCEKLN